MQRGTARPCHTEPSFTAFVVLALEVISQPTASLLKGCARMLTLAVGGLAAGPHAQGVSSGYPRCSHRPGLNQFRRSAERGWSGDSDR